MASESPKMPLKEGSKKILYLITKSNFGGAQRYVFDLALEAKNRGVDVVVALGGQGALKEKLDERGIRTLVLKNLERDVKWIKDPTSTLSQILKILYKEQPDIVHLNSAKAGGIGAFAVRLINLYSFFTRKKHGMVSVFTAHGFAFNENRGPVQKIIIVFATWLTMALTDQIIAVGEAVKSRVENWPLIGEKIIVIPNGVSEHAYLDRSEARKFLAPNAKGRPIWIGTMAELHHIKGLSYAIRAMKSVSQKYEIVFVIMGEGEERTQLESLIKAEGLEGKVILKGYVENAPTYLKAFDIFTLTSISEAMPLSLLEAGMASLPVIATNVGGVGEVVENEKTGLLIEPRNIIGIFRSLERLIEDKTFRGKLGKNIQEKVKTEFSKENMLRKTFAFYEANT